MKDNLIEKISFRTFMRMLKTVNFENNNEKHLKLEVRCKYTYKCSV